MCKSFAALPTLDSRHVYSIRCWILRSDYLGDTISHSQLEEGCSRPGDA